MNQLSTEKRTQIVSMLVEGNSMRSITRMTGVSINTVTKLLVDMGKVCGKAHYELVRNLAKTTKVQVDEIWCFSYCKEKNVTADRPEWAEFVGDVWTWVGIDADNKLVISWMVGDRGYQTGSDFMTDLASRLTNRIQLTSDGLNMYPDLVRLAFGDHIDFAQLVKIYGSGTSEDWPRRYSPSNVISALKKTVIGDPSEANVSTSYVERQNLTMRMHMRRYTRLSNGFSKKLDNHCHALCLHYMYYNFVKIHKTLRVTPAMEAGIASDPWEVVDLVKLLDK